MEKAAIKLSRNPLGIIALFIVLIYSFASLLFGLSGDALTENQKWVFVIFLVAFPVIVLFIFTYLVIKHHQKLYAPGDFQNEENFWGRISAEEKQTKYEIEAQENVDKTEDKAAPKRDDDEQRRKQIGERREKIQRVETLVFDYYEKKFDYVIDKDVFFKIKDRRVSFDGVSVKENTVNFFIIKYVSTSLMPDLILSKNIFDTVKVRDSLIKNNNYPGYQYRLRLNLVIETEDANEIYEFKKRINSLIETEVINIDLRVFTVKELESM